MYNVSSCLILRLFPRPFGKEFEKIPHNPIDNVYRFDILMPVGNRERFPNATLRNAFLYGSFEMHNRESLEAMKRHELMSLANTRSLAEWPTIQKTSNGDLIEAILSGHLNGHSTNGNGSSNHNGHANGDLAAVIALAVQSHLNIKPDFDESRVREIAREEAQGYVRQIEVKRVDGSKVNIGKAHRCFEALLAFLSCGQNVMLIGPAGSGKTSAAEKAAEALGLEFSAISVGAMSAQHEFLGFIDAQGNYRTTEFRKRFENGGIFLVDEVDGGNPAILNVLNAALANGVCAFPDGMVRRHADFMVIAAANTWGKGADREYVGRNQLDAAFLDRFAKLPWNYDEDLERDIALEISGNHSTAQDWINYVQSARESAQANRIRVVITPRASIQGAKMLAAGIDRETVETAWLWGGMDAATKSKIQTGS